MGRRRTIRTAALAATLLIGCSAGLGIRADAQSVDPTWTLSPSTVSNGSTVTASGTGCLDPDTDDGTGMQAVVIIPHLAYPNSDNPEGTAYFLSDPVAADGSWTLTATVDTREDFFGPYEDFATTASAGCLRGGTEPIFTYEQTYDIRYTGQQPSSTLPPTQVPTTTAPPVSGPAASPAAPVAAAPTFTG
jgi:hypothetical protein